MAARGCGFGEVERLKQASSSSRSSNLKTKTKTKTKAHLFLSTTVTPLKPPQATSTLKKSPHPPEASRTVTDEDGKRVSRRDVRRAEVGRRRGKARVIIFFF